MQTYPIASGLYDPRFEHDSCGVSFVAHMRGVAVQRAGADRVVGAVQPRAPRRHRGGGGHRRRRRDPDPDPRPAPARRRSTSSSRRPGGYAVGVAFLPADDGLPRQGPGHDRDDRRRLRAHRARLARRADPARLPRQDRARGDAGVPAAVRVVAERRVRDRPRSPDVRRPQADRARAAGASCRIVLLVAVGAHDRLQGDVHARRSSASSTPTSPTPGSRARCCWCTRGSRPTRSRRGRSPTRTATSPTTARSTPCRATRTGCAPARRWPPATLLPDLDKAFPICTEGASDTARFDEVLELLHLGGPTAAPRGADDDPGGVGEQRRDGRRPAGVLPVPRQRDGAVGRPGQRRRSPTAP